MTGEIFHRNSELSINICSPEEWNNWRDGKLYYRRNHLYSETAVNEYMKQNFRAVLEQTPQGYGFDSFWDFFNNSANTFHIDFLTPKGEEIMVFGKRENY